MLQELRLTVVVDSSAPFGVPSLWAQHGLSIFLELDYGKETMKMLLDTGAGSEVLLHNSDAMHIDLSHLDLICLSHGHYDHTGGLMGILERSGRKICVLAHPEIFAPKLKMQPFLKFIGPPFSEEEAEAAGAVMLQCRGPVAIAPDVMTTGEVTRQEAFEKAEGFWTVRDGRYCQDNIQDDMALAINIEGKGLAVISGCAHAGIVNTIKHAQKITGVEELYAVIGGFHLTDADSKRIDATAGALRSLDPAIVRPGHCTGHRAICRLREALGERCLPLAVGDAIRL
ncbi:MAG TPA: MBL fold metallo-hydrolase [Methanothrix soehngenii]|jgi:7,8-dihydropterin-6-yl-methyl-4-(beta-D-ribofuranosyl)aminobenzene 5'-phosphate synthase|nr:MBL fold metallo-hydrolase [Methanothrix soehngenii]